MSTHAQILTGLRAVSLDAGHTLLRPEPAVEERYAQTVAAYGLTVEPREIQVRFGRLWKEGRQERQERLYQTDDAGTKAFWKEFVGEVFSPWRGQMTDYDAFFEQLYEDFASRSAWLLFDDALPALDRLEGKGYRLLVISNWDTRLRGLLERLAVAHRFEQIVISAEEGFEKPAPRIFERALEALELRPEEVLHVGDSFEDDVEGALAVGIRAAYLDRHDRGTDDDRWLRVPSLLDLADRLPATTA